MTRRRLLVTIRACALVLVACRTPPGAPPAADATAMPTRVPPADAPTPADSVAVADADVEYVRAVEASDGTWTFHVTVRHADAGWDDYADGWDVVAPDGTVLKPDPESPFTRLLLHPHVNEQPFTRSRSGIVVPPAVERVRVRAHDLVHGYGGDEVIVDFTAAPGPDYEIVRSASSDRNHLLMCYVTPSRLANRRAHCGRACERTL